MISPQKYYTMIPSGEPTQGDIWTNLPFPAFEAQFNLGLLITPKCDFAHEKTKVFNYVPAIFFDDYLRLFGYSRILSEEVNRQRDHLSGLNLQYQSFSLLEIGVPEYKVLDLMKDEIKTKTLSSKDKVQYDKFKQSVAILEQINNLVQEIQIPKVDALIFIKPKDIIKHRDKVIRNQIVDLHFLPPCPPVIDNSLILLLRYINTCQMDLLNIANNTVNDADWSIRCQDFNDVVDIFKFCKHKPDRILRLKSPYLENLMNRIALLYMRIGIPDFPKSEYDHFLKEE